MAEVSLSQTKMQVMSNLGADWWNDSCATDELSQAAQEGAVGATSNPVIVSAAVKSQEELWLPVLDKIIQDNPSDTEDDIAWKLIATIGKEAAKLLYPVYERTNGEKGYLSMQVNPKFYPNKDLMVKQGEFLSSLAPNIAIKAPATETGIAAIEEMTALGIRVNATVSFSVSQAVAAAEAMERGIKRAKDNGIETENIYPYVTIMVGRIDDQLRRVRESEEIDIDPTFIDWAGVAVFKKTHQIFKPRGYRGKLLSAAYRNNLQWSELIGVDVLQTIPYAWWNRFNDSTITPHLSIEEPVDEEILSNLHEKFSDFRKAYDEDGMEPEEFIHYGGTINTLHQFIGGYLELIELVRGRMLSPGVR